MYSPLIKLIKRINELTKISRERELTPDELEERKKLRSVFLENFRAGFRQQLEDTVVIDKDGKEVTSEKAKEAQRRKGLRKD